MEEGLRAADVDPALYEALRHLAQRVLGKYRRNQTLHRTALVHEAYLRWARLRAPHLSEPAFMAFAARAMRSALVDHYRRNMAQKRFGDCRRAALADVPVEFEQDALDLVMVDQAIERLRLVDERLATIVDLRFFAGLAEGDVAGALGVSERTVRREWRLARAWLERELSRDEEHAQLGAGQTDLS